MSELINARKHHEEFRWQLLTTVSALSLLTIISASSKSEAADQNADRPTVWVELGGQLERVNGQESAFPVGFLAANPNSPVLQPVTPLEAQNPSPFGFGEEGKILLQPENSDWAFSAALRYGRSNNSKEVDHQTNRIIHPKYFNGVAQGIQTVADFADTRAANRESHMVLDFSAGKDIGLGMFGRSGSSTLSIGVRFAQFSSSATADIRARPDLQLHYVPSAAAPNRLQIPYFHTYHITGQASRSFHGLGPSLSWSGSTPFIGEPQSSEITFDWGVNAAILFGRQRAHIQHHESSNYVSKFDLNRYYLTGYRRAGGHDTNRSVTVPNVGGFAGISFQRGDAKVSLGYRGDFFFGPIDGGIDTRKSENVGFHGPFATISVGLGG